MPQRAVPSRTGLLVAVALGAGLVLAALAVILPVVPVEEHALTGAILVGFAAGWGLVAVLTARFTDQPQRWAAAPAILLGLVGVVGLSGSAVAQAAARWVWPPVLLALVVWMFPRVRRQLHSRSRWLLVQPVLAVLGMAALGGGYETVREALDARAYPPPGQLVDVGGHRLHLQCTGAGSPTVVVEPGLGATSSALSWVTPGVARDTRVCVYDRAGRGWSDPAAGPQDAAAIADDLHTLLERAGVPGPYVLGGHSFGGLYILRFAAEFPGDVAGMVLIDSTAPKPGPALPAGSAASPALDRLLAVLPAFAHLGVERVLAQFSYDNLPPSVQSPARAHGSTARDRSSSLEEFRQGAASMQQAASLTTLGAKPLIVVTADTGNDASWQAAQEDLAALSSNSLHRSAHGTHMSLVGDRADATAVSQALTEVVTAVRTGRPLRER